ncbi:phosphoenolpyruvate carboxykinase (GTP) [Brooklawnia cerclae]|uniref:Phosphoenolpyruvate carboxykinase [GTP] n=1 Tax=Brooklawnia cerclae TaxID=349934 RepID=A0ABX0SKD1_9ACTN|nr:phosphoenolpyruvate carboxykinase (GTP) [Brooklawnia cerclae]NIH58779.1 phosphoenolpyruvate carboxykinase (GTP) [Brooklawnia cerclae]
MTVETTETRQETTKGAPEGGEASLTQGIPTIGEVPRLARLVEWVARVAELTRPAAIRYCDGSETEWHELVDLLVDKGCATRLAEDRFPNSIYVRTDPDDVARVEDQTFICSVREEDAGPLNNWMNPRAMKRIMRGLYEGCMEGRTMYVIPFCMGPLDAVDPKFGVEVTDSPYVVCSMRIMTRMGRPALDEMVQRDAAFVPCLHSVGLPLPPGTKDVTWPCDSQHVYISHFPEERTVWSYGSGYGGNSLLGKKCYALRIASVMARDEGWLAEHMLILKLTSPQGKTYHICAAFPSACGKTNLAMIRPTIPGWKAETIGDDIAWMRFGPDGRLYAVNPETGFFGVAPGTGDATNPNAMATIREGNSIFTNVALTDDGGVWWEGMTEQVPEHLMDWRGRSWTREYGPEGGRHTDKAAHPNSRFTTPTKQCPTLAEEFDSPRGVPIDIMIFGGRRENTIPLVNEAHDWQHGVFLGATCSSETTAAAVGMVGVVRRDPMAMRPFIGYHVGDYLEHWLKIGRTHDRSRLPRIFYVNWFLKDAQGRFLWPGFGDNSRVLKWMIDRLEGRVDAIQTPIGLLPKPEDIDVNGLDIDPATVRMVTRFVPHEWVDELPRIGQWFDFLGDKLPTELDEEYARLRSGVLKACEREPRPR